ncbi:MAG: SMC-Scp complex subunit ScpB [Candidatus Pacebacteria bacterium]|nr:SMC-Scp complex subunit ScpB [Candidatus Paceibacterota bacterium]
MSLKSKIESLLFVSPKPLSVNDLAKSLKAEKKEVENNLQQLQNYYHDHDSGLQLISTSGKYQLTSAVNNSEIVRDFLAAETSGELSQPSLETLTIIAYRGPISKTELERIRGVNCSLILRNLLIRGLVEEQKSRSEEKIYNVSLDFLRYLGVDDLKQLPDYERLNKDQTISDFLSGSLQSENQLTDKES